MVQVEHFGTSIASSLKHLKSETGQLLTMQKLSEISQDEVNVTVGLLAEGLREKICLLEQHEQGLLLVDADLANVVEGTLLPQISDNVKLVSQNVADYGRVNLGLALQQLVTEAFGDIAKLSIIMISEHVCNRLLP